MFLVPMALIIISHGIDYYLFAKEEKPSVDKVCGGFIPARALDEFKLGPINGAREIASLIMKFPGMNVVRVNFDNSEILIDASGANPISIRNGLICAIVKAALGYLKSEICI